MFEVDRFGRITFLVGRLVEHEKKSAYKMSYAFYSSSKNILWFYKDTERYTFSTEIV